IERTVHGPVIGRTTAIDPATGQPVPVAVSSQRSTFGDELGAAPAFLLWNDPDVIHGATDFQRAAGKETGTFNWTYVDSRDVAYCMSGKLPIRNPHVNPNFSAWGTGQWEGQGFVPIDLSGADVHPRASAVPGAHRRNRSGTGSYKQGNAVALMDKLYPRVVHAVFDPWLAPRPNSNDGDSFGLLAGLNPLNDPPRAQGSAYDGGWEGYVQRALRQALNPRIRNGYSQVYCGGDGNGGKGSLASCRTALKTALQST